MPYTKNAVTSLAQGVSQQAESQRHPSQAVEQINGYSSHIKGLVKRPPTKWVAKINANSGVNAGKTFLHTINRDSAEQYLLVVNKGVQEEIGYDSVNGQFMYVNTSFVDPSVGNVKNGTVITFYRTQSKHLPVVTGLLAGTEYYVRDLNTTAKTFKVAATSGGAAISTGMVELTRPEFGKTNDEYKAGLLIESIRLSDNTWLDGVLTVRFGSITSSPGHNFSEGGVLRGGIQNVQGTAGYIYQRQDYIITQKDPDGAALPVMHRTGSGNVALRGSGTSGEVGNKFWLKSLMKSNIRSEDFGYARDGDQLFGTDSRVGWSAVGSELFEIDGDEVSRLGSSSRDLSVYKPGQLMMIGSGSKNPRAIVKSSTTSTITFVGNVELADYTGATDDDSGSGKVHLKFWSNKSNFATRYFEETDYRSFVYDSGNSGTHNNSANEDWAYVGQNSGHVMCSAGDQGTGPYIYDAQTGEEMELDRSTPFSQEAIEYLLDVNDPTTDLKAATVGDTTFIVNKTIPVRNSNYIPHHKKYEAFIQIQQADYGKTYRIQVGREAISTQKLDNTAGDPATGADPVKARALLFGAAGATDLAVPICAIRAKELGPGFDGVRVRLVQNWAWNKGNDDVAVVDHLLESTKNQEWHDLMPNIAARRYSNAMQGYAYWNHIKALEDKGEFGDKDSWQVFFQNHGNKNVAAFYTYGQEITIFVNFPWFRKHNKHQAPKTTTVLDLKNIFITIPELRDHFEVVNCDASGRPYDETDSTASKTGNDNFIFLKGELHNEKRMASYVDAGLAGDEPYVDWESRNHWIGKDTHTLKLAGSHRWGGGWTTWHTSYGLQSPSMNAGTTDAFPTERLNTRGQALVTGGTGTKVTSDFGHSDGGKRVYDGEYFYRSPKWTGNAGISATTMGGDKAQKAIGTERIAEMLASNCYIAPNASSVTTYMVDAKLVKADGRVTTDGTYAPEHGEEGLGLTFTKADLVTGPISSQTKILQRFSDGSKRIDGWGDNGTVDRDWQVIQEGNVISIRNPNLSEFNIRVSDDMGGNGMSLTYFEVDESVKLPDICRHGHVVKVVGDAREEADDYYLRFESDTNDVTRLSHGRWVECVGYGVQDRFARGTMPVTLIRNFDENGKRTFALAQTDFNNRKAGDDRSNPFPSFANRKITDIFLHKNRLGILSGEDVSLSEAGEYHNFFRTTVSNLLDTAPIDVTASTNKVSHLKSAIPYSDRLLIFSPQTQFSLTGEPFLSPKSVQITVSSHFVNSATATPVLAGNQVFFTFPRTGFGAVSDFGLSPEQIETMVQNDITSHVPKYIKGNIRKLTACPEEKIIVAVTDDETDSVIYVYKYFLDTQGAKSQSAWFKYRLGKTGDRILNADFIGNILYIVIERNDSCYLESLVFEDDQTDTGLDYQVLLDRRRLVNGASPPTGWAVSYDSGNTQSSVTVDYKIAAKEHVEVVTVADGKRHKASIKQGDNTVKFDGVNLKTQSFYIGEPYTLEYTFSKPYLRRNTGQGGRGVLVGGRHQLTRGNLEFTNAKAFSVSVTHQPQNVSVNSNFTFSGVELGYASAIIGADTLSEGSFPFGIMGRNDRVSILVSNDTPYPSDFLSLDYEGRIYARGNRWTG